MTVYERFLKYVSYPTTSNEDNPACPSTEGQRVLANELCRELIELGITDARVDANGYVYASIPANCEGMDSIGLIAHMDTASEASGENIKPKMIDYQGGDIVLNAEKNIILKASDYPFVASLAGQRLIVTDGTTLLGADDKAGIAEIMTAAEFILKSNVSTAKYASASLPTRRSAAVQTSLTLRDLAQITPTLLTAAHSARSSTRTSMPQVPWSRCTAERSIPEVRRTR